MASKDKDHHSKVGRGLAGTAQQTVEGTAPTSESPLRVDTKARGPAQPFGLVSAFPISWDELPQVWPIRSESAIGRSRRAQVLLTDSQVSRVHAWVEPRNDGLFVRDDTSRHGTFINGQRVSRDGALARAGSVVRVGDTLLLVAQDVDRFRARPRRCAGARFGLSDTMVAGPALAAVWDEATRAGRLMDSVLILGETGSGKECVARILHSARSTPGPLVGINAAAVPDALFEAELFGFERGAFSGANVARPGAFREASGGTLFLDEVGDLKLELQAKLLRALDRGQVRPLGASRDADVDVRVVTATSRNLREDCNDGRFRIDLYYRLSGIVIKIPPLRERREDILLLAQEMLAARAPRLRLSTDAAERLALGKWEGNARELRQVVSQAAFQALSVGAEELSLEHLPQVSTGEVASKELSVARVQDALLRCGGVVSHAARLLSVSRTTLYEAMKRHKAEGNQLAAENGTLLPGDYPRPAR